MEHVGVGGTGVSLCHTRQTETEEDYDRLGWGHLSTLPASVNVD